jgi:hypothetical protein
MHQALADLLAARACRGPTPVFGRGQAVHASFPTPFGRLARYEWRATGDFAGAMPAAAAGQASVPESRALLGM